MPDVIERAIDGWDNNDKTPLHQAVIMGDHKAAQLLLDLRA
jgi:hypothetical protein